MALTLRQLALQYVADGSGGATIALLTLPLPHLLQVGPGGGPQAHSVVSLSSYRYRKQTGSI